MEHSFNILLNRFFSGASEYSVNSNLKYANNYYLNESGAEDTIVDFSNIRAFLSNENNQKIVKEYHSFLSSSSVMNSALLVNPNSSLFTPTPQFKAIYYDDDKLADSFNNFYNTSILKGISFNDSDVFNSSIRNQLLDNEISQYSYQNIFHNHFLWSSSSCIAHSFPKYPFENAILDIYGGLRNDSTEEILVNIPINEDAYYVNIFLTKKFTQTAKMSFDICDNIIYKISEGNAVFSQNPNDIIKHSDYLKNTNTEKTVSFDNVYIKTPKTNLEINDSELNKQNYENNNSFQTLNNQQNISLNELTSINLRAVDGVLFNQITPILSGITLNTNLSGASKKLIQCFVDPNFLTNEDDLWSDNKFNSMNMQNNVFEIILTGNIVN
jgi:hypothetical protein